MLLIACAFEQPYKVSLVRESVQRELDKTFAALVRLKPEGELRYYLLQWAAAVLHIELSMLKVDLERYLAIHASVGTLRDAFVDLTIRYAGLKLDFYGRLLKDVRLR